MSENQVEPEAPPALDDDPTDADELAGDEVEPDYDDVTGEGEFL